MVNTITLRHQIGIDRIKLKFVLEDGPFTISESFMKGYGLYCAKAHKDDPYVAMDSKGNLYKYISFCLTNNEHIIIKNNQNRIIVNIDLTRKPICNHEVLGNIENATYEEVNNQLNSVLELLHDIGDFDLDNINVCVSEIEINRTFITPFDFILTSQFFMYLCQQKNYAAQVTYNKRFPSFNEMSPIDERTNKISKKNSEIVIYDKKRETEKKQKDRKKLIINEEISRIEFRAKREDVIISWFGTVLWKDLSQEIIELAYNKRCEECLFKTYETVKEMRKKMVENFIVSYKSSKNFKPSLRDYYIKFLREYKIPFSISENEFDIRPSIRSNRILNPNCNKTKKINTTYHDVIRESGLFYDPNTATYFTLDYVKNFIFDCLNNKTIPLLEVHYTS